MQQPYCPQCGGPAKEEVPPGDNRPRRVCASCDAIYYENPRIIAGVVAMLEDKVLLCRRAIPPREGYWTLPAGYLESGESVEEGACREAWEEARARVHVRALLSVYSVPHIDQVHIYFLSDLKDASVEAGEETLEVGLFSREEIPRAELAFPTVQWALDHAWAVRDRIDFAPDCQSRQGKILDGHRPRR